MKKFLLLALTILSFGSASAQWSSLTTTDQAALAGGMGVTCY